MTINHLIKRAIFIIVLPLLIFGCTSSNSSRPSPDPNEEPPEEIVELDLSNILQRGYITAIMDNSSTGLFIYRGKTMGYEYELLQAFARSIGVELRINITPSLEEGFRKLNNGEGDILAYNLTVTKERKKKDCFYPLSQFG